MSPWKYVAGGGGDGGGDGGGGTGGGDGGGAGGGMDGERSGHSRDSPDTAVHKLLLYWHRAQFPSPRWKYAPPGVK